MDLDDGGVDHGELHIRIIRYSLEKPLENIGLHPVAIALEDRVPLAEKLGKVAPRTASARDPKHGLNKQPIVAAAPPRIARLSQAIRLHLRPLGVGHYESVHPKLESRQTHNGNPNSQQTLACQGFTSSPLSGILADQPRRPAALS